MDQSSKPHEDCINLIQKLYQVGFCRIHDKTDAETFSRNNMLSDIQLILSTDAIMTMRASIDGHTLYLLSDPFKISILVFKMGDDFMVFGPFTSLIHTRQHAAHIIQMNGLDKLSIEDYLRYREHFPTISTEQAEHIVRSFLSTCGQSPESYVMRSPETFAIDKTYETSVRDRKHLIDLLELRYANEKEFIESVQNGDARSALRYLEKMQSDVRYMKELGSTIENERIGCAITRTTLRITAMKAGLPAYIIDRLSGQNTREVHREKHLDKILASKERMVVNFCHAIQEHKEKSYSPVISNAIFYLNNNFRNEISLDDITRKFAMSKSCFMSGFKSETGMTPMNYLRSVRIKKACTLLSGTGKSIQEISESVGIPDSNYFVKQFRKETGMTPTDYRKTKRF
ncbi:hypothetical protein BXO88_06830 [Oribacterium sp. C9]|uniref:helix-turn-helix transcriptional regulator n=1 Tax=Oribacterium sp. C9 TaxID=1943579 RepID=UPI0009CED89D|nr:AraC family transcriptional regulator [Oribacterium sp. C9]OON86700.1 hypothetical protein BXO88_06830 [Oribacterium sp. C9]